MAAFLSLSNRKMPKDETGQMAKAIRKKPNEQRWQAYIRDVLGEDGCQKLIKQVRAEMMRDLFRNRNENSNAVTRADRK